jgi:nucleotide-binding universal stress UspA family protein
MITLKRILVPHDFSETSEAAMKYATELARIFGAKLHVLHVSETARTDIPTDFPLGLEKGMEEAVRERLLKTVPGRDKREFHPNFALRSGTPSAEIVRYAKERDIDLIVMGTHGRGLIAHAVMGSVTEKVVRNAPCPVLTLPWWAFALGVASPRASELFPASIQPLAYA